jgi:DNA polymerase-3 subunit chi
MAAVAFHFNVADLRDYGCRLLRKADRAGARLAVSGPPTLLAELDRWLWLFDPQEFVPHWRGTAIAALPPRLAETPIVLLDQVDGAQVAARYPVWVNLGGPPPPGVEAFERVVEIVGQGDAEREAARQRWRWYAGQQWPIERHDAQG